MVDLDPFLTLATELADAAGAAVRPYFRRPLLVDDKPDLSPVTAADRAAEAAMRRLIAAQFPAHGIIGEEFRRGARGRRFRLECLDPIDGTKSFISGVPLFRHLDRARRPHGRPASLGSSTSRSRVSAGSGRAVARPRFNGAPARCRACACSAGATVPFSTSPDMFPGDDAAAHARVASAAKLVRFGADCYAYGILALGCIDLVIEASLKPYDFSAMSPIIEGAGGIATDWRGAPLTLASDGRVLAAGDRRAHEAALALLAA